MLNDWKNKTVCFLGDSITEAIGVKPEDRYFEIIAREIPLTAAGFGISGNRFDDLMPQVDRMLEKFGKNVDAIFMFAGTNDYNRCIPLGEWYMETVEDVAVDTDEDGNPTRMEQRKRRYFNTNPSTVRGSINRLLLYTRQNYPTTPIILLTPLHRAFAYFGGDNIQHDEMYANKIGIYYDEYVEIVRQAAKIHSTELIDLYQCSGMFPLNNENAAEYFVNEKKDRLHPNKCGHERLAKIITAAMNNIVLQ